VGCKAGIGIRSALVGIVRGTTSGSNKDKNMPVWFCVFSAGESLRNIVFASIAGGEKRGLKALLCCIALAAGLAGPDSHAMSSSRNAEEPSLAIAADGTPYVGYNDRDNGYRATVKRFDGESWRTLGRAGFSAGYAHPRLAAAAGRLYAAYSEPLQERAGKATVMQFDGNDWQPLGRAAFTTGRADYLALAAAPDGTPYIAYSDGANNDRATVMRFRAGFWETVGDAGFSAGRAGYFVLRIAAADDIYLIYEDAVKGDGATVMRFDGSRWQPLGEAGFPQEEILLPELAIAADGSVYFAYTRWRNYRGEAMVMRFDGNNWQTVDATGLLEDAPEYALMPAMAVAEDGTPYLAYVDGGDDEAITVKRLRNGRWETLGNTGFSALDSRVLFAALPQTLKVSGAGKALAADLLPPPRTLYELPPCSLSFSFALAADGSPYIVYADQDNDCRATVRRFNGSSWQVVGRRGLSLDGGSSCRSAQKCFVSRLADSWPFR